MLEGKLKTILRGTGEKPNPVDHSNLKCLRCKAKGHISANCPDRKKTGHCPGNQSFKSSREFNNGSAADRFWGLYRMREGNDLM